MSLVNAKNNVLSGEGTQFQLLSLVKKFASTALGLYFMIFLLIHRYSYWLQRQLLFMHFVRWPLNVDFNKADKFGLNGVKNFYLSTKDCVKIGVWQILPASYAKQNITSETFDEAFGDGKPIIVYAHGNTGNRATKHRLQLYKLLQLNDYHVISFDYRCFGDSSNVLPDETGLIEDACTVLRWVLDRKKNSPVYVWGHSLGTAIGSRAITEFEKQGDLVDGLILEAPFNNLEDAIRNHPFSSFFSHMIGYDYFIVKPIQENGITFKTDKYLAASKIPVFILHAEDDWILPSILSKKLYDYLLKNRSKATENVKFVEFAKTGYGHKYICTAPELMKLVNSFLSGKLDEIPAFISATGNIDDANSSAKK